MVTARCRETTYTMVRYLRSTVSWSETSRGSFSGTSGIIAPIVRSAKIGEKYLPVLHQDVLRLDVFVSDLFPMQVSQRRCKAPEKSSQTDLPVLLISRTDTIGIKVSE